MGMERNPGNPSGEKIRRSTRQDAEKLAALYKTVFAVYPTPLGDPAYIQKTMENGTVYVHIEKEGKVLSAASAEVNHTFANAEMTDCATLPAEQGRGYMAALLARLEEILIPDEIQCLYTICRARSFGVNKVFYNLGYEYSGCLVNNCHIYSGLENMNVWYKLRN
jgi:putative beta-lysine N-acetyltransferase